MVNDGEEEETNQNQPPNGPNPKPPRAKRKVNPRALVWEHFTRLVDDVNTSMCKYCGLELGCNSVTSGTSPMISHNKRCKMFKDFGDSDKQKGLAPDASGKMKAVIQYDPAVFRKAVNELVVVNELSFLFVESDGFKHFCATVVPSYKTFSRIIASRDIANIYLAEKSTLKRVFSVEKKRVSLTTDIWVAPSTSYNYMVVTAHWIDNDWRLLKKIIGFKVITDHKGETIARHLSDYLAEWEIEKFFTITVDNARNNDKALRFFTEEFCMTRPEALVLGGAYLHMRCYAYILNLVVRDGLAKTNDSIVAIRNAVKYVRSSFRRLKSFELRCEIGKVSRGSLALDCATRWNSTYMMWSLALKLCGAFEKMVAEDKLYCDYFLEEEERGKKRIGPPLPVDWDEVEVLVKFLKIFFNSTVAFSASKTVTSTYCYNEIVTIERNLISRSYNCNREIRDQATTMRDKFDKYWDGLLNMNPLVIIASVFDPRNKMQFATLCFEKLYGKNNVEYTQLHAVVTNVLKKMYQEYNLRAVGDNRHDNGENRSDNGDSEHQSPVINMLDDDNDYERMDCLYSQMVSERRHEEVAIELDMYLLQKPEICLPNNLGMDYDVLAWWRCNSSKFPILSEISKDVLAIQVTSVASESAFSTSGRILDPYMSFFKLLT